MYSAANRDPDMFDEPQSFCPERDEATNHLAFGRGIHFCVGAALSTTRGQGGRLKSSPVASRRSSWTPLNTFEYHPSFMLRGLKRLDVHLTAA